MGFTRTLASGKRGKLHGLDAFEDNLYQPVNSSDTAELLWGRQAKNLNENKKPDTVTDPCV